jgi:katanin p60 ATPase-containing subunit A1
MDEIVDNVKMAREYALLGNYDTALVYFQGVLQQIQKHIVAIVDPVRKQKWHQVKAVFCLNI